MIVAYRTTHIGNLNLANLLVLPSYLVPLSDAAALTFRGWDEAYLKLKSDPDATRMYSLDDRQDPRLMEFNTAGLAASRSLPRLHRAGAHVYTLACDKSPGSEDIDRRTVWTNFPKWAHLVVETKSGDIHQVTGNEAVGQWKKWAADADDLYLHVSLFAPFAIEDLTSLIAHERELSVAHRVMPQLAETPRAWQQRFKFTMRIPLDPDTM